MANGCVEGERETESLNKEEKEEGAFVLTFGVKITNGLFVGNELMK